MKKLILLAIFMLCSCGYQSVIKEKRLNDMLDGEGKRYSYLVASEKLNEISLAFQLSAEHLRDYNDISRTSSQILSYSDNHKKNLQHDFKSDESMNYYSLMKYKYLNGISISDDAAPFSFNEKILTENIGGDSEKGNTFTEKLKDIIKVFSEDSVKSIYSFILLLISTTWGMLLLSSSESKAKADRAMSLLNKASLVLDKISNKHGFLVNDKDVEEFLYYIESAKQALENVTLQEHFLDVRYYSQLIVVNLVPWDVQTELRGMKWLSMAERNLHINTGRRESIEKKYKSLEDDLNKLPGKLTKSLHLFAKAVLILLFFLFVFFLLYFFFLS